MNTKISMTRDEAAANGFAVFNRYAHVCLVYDEQRGDKGNGLTVSVKLPDGRHVTFAICPNDTAPGGVECVDVQLDRTGETYQYPDTRFGRDCAKQDRSEGGRRVQRGIMFGPGSWDNRIWRRSEHGGVLYGSILTLLVNPRHYNEPEWAPVSTEPIRQQAEQQQQGREYQPKTGQRCTCKRGQERDNCPRCEGTGQVIDFAAIRARASGHPIRDPEPDFAAVEPGASPSAIADGNAAPAAPDYSVENHGSLYLVRCMNQNALEHLADNVSDEAQWMGEALAVEHRYISDLVTGLRGNGFTVGTG